MSAAFDVDLEIGHLSGKGVEGTTIDDYDLVDENHYGGPQVDASGPTQGHAKLADGASSSVVGHSHRDSPRKMWGLHPTRYKKDILKNGKGHIESILLFVRMSRVLSAVSHDLTLRPFFSPLPRQTGLFSATVSLVVLGSYNNLSPDPSEQTVALLNQVSQQLMGMSRGTPLAALPPNPMLFRPSSPVVRATILWFLSLGLNITCAIWAILWWQRYTNPLGQSSEPHRRARVRAYLFSGIGHVDVEHTVEAIWVLLHASVLFFIIGLLDFLLRTNKTVAYVFLAYIVPFALVYIAAMLLPCFFSNSYSFTPSTSGSRKLSQLDNRRPASQPQFRHPPYIGDDSWRDDREH
ncbi:hypothetical protein EDB92DRAFT_1819683 [Lactarius akahatsu]|uniref:DUF6535 domain-containing protein n=1 Tax=Lactarius akahatsu TaxID=416441 RepID=A0AAD4Q9D2_9AGAM|nr:hypothetical protein EDB92DRAFT_1819683 [Lactarius akahatsu]